MSASWESHITDLVELLTPRDSGGGRWTGQPGPAMGPRLFGGQAIGQALMAAGGLETSGRLPHSLHAYFLKAGSASDPVDYTVSQLSEGRSFATRRVEANQGGTLILSLIASFHVPEAGFSHSTPSPFPLDFEAASASLESWLAKNRRGSEVPFLERLRHRPIEIVPLDPGSLFGTRPREPLTASWMRVRQRTTASPIMQRALLAYASDMMFLRNALLPHAIRPGSDQLQAASLDHAIWFHETPDFDRWHLFVTSSPWAGSARGLNRGHFYAEDGTMVASVAQENLMRPRGSALERVKGAANG